MKTYAIIPSGGIGKRLNSSLPKQYVKINGKELIAYTIEIFQSCDLIDEIIIAAQKDFFPLLEEIKRKYNFTKLTNFVEGGKERQDSVYNALLSIDGNDGDTILVHDAARPLLPKEILTQALNSSKKFDNIIVAMKASDTLVKASEFVEKYLNRDEIYHVQTPQISKFKILLNAMKSAKNKYFLGTDESILLFRTSNKIKIIDGSSLNFKVTTQSDLDLFKIISDIKVNS